MDNKNLHWEIISKKKPESTKEIIDILLKNRGLNGKSEREAFFNPESPEKISLKELDINEESLNKALIRIETAISKKQRVIIYGDYDTDGVCATAILWESLFALGANVLPYIPNRFEEGYGINPKSIEALKTQYSDLSLIITVDNGIVAAEAVNAAEKFGIDVIVTDHHQKGKVLPDALSIVHTDKISGSGVSWILSREINKKLGKNRLPYKSGLELAAVGTIADMLPLIGPNRSVAKYGLEELNNTGRPGLLALFEEAAIDKGDVGTYEINYLIAPRLNAMGRLEHAIDSLRLLCTKNVDKARSLALFLGRTNRQRQEIVAEVLKHARQQAIVGKWKGAIVLADESYHEGVIGLAAGKLVEEFYRPSIVISRGIEISKASARSVSGFNIIENIRKLDSIIVGGGGHPMAAGFSIRTEKIDIFIKEFEKVSSNLLTDEVLQKKLKIDCEIEFENINEELYRSIKSFEPTGIGNPVPTFVTADVKVIDARVVGKEGKHLKLNLSQKNTKFPAIAFGMGDRYKEISSSEKVDAAFVIDENIWNGSKSLQLRIKDIHC